MPKLRVFRQKDVHGIANSEDPDQTAPLRAVSLCIIDSNTCYQVNRYKTVSGHVEGKTIHYFNVESRFYALRKMFVWQDIFLSLNFIVKLATWYREKYVSFETLPFILQTEVIKFNPLF